MIREMATLGYFLMMATMADDISRDQGSHFGRKLTVNVLCLVDIELANSKLTIGGLCSTVTTRKVVNDKGGNLVAADILDGVLSGSDLSTSVAEKWLVEPQDL